MRDDEHAFDDLLRRALDRAGEPAPFPVEVGDRVMARVRSLGPPERAGLGRKHLVRWLIAAAIGGVALLAGGTWLFWGSHEIGTLLARAVGTATKLVAPAAVLASALRPLGEAAGRALRVLVDTAAPFRPLAQLVLALTAVAMFSISALVVARDVRGRVVRKETS